MPPSDEAALSHSSFTSNYYNDDGTAFQNPNMDKQFFGLSTKSIKWICIAFIFLVGIGIGLGIGVFPRVESPSLSPPSHPGNDDHPTHLTFPLRAVHQSCLQKENVDKIPTKYLTPELRTKRDSFLNSLEFVENYYSDAPSFVAPPPFSCDPRNLAAYYTAVGSGGGGGAGELRFQRFVLTVLYLSLLSNPDNDNNNNRWNESSNWTELEDECDWEGVTCFLRNIHTLDLSEHSLKGELPPELFLLTSLRKLHLGSNELGGTLSSSIAKLSNLESLRLMVNQFEGTIPDELFQLSKLTDLDLHLNSFQGRIPSSITNLKHLRHLSIGQNDLTGPIPPELASSAKRLVSLSLFQNRLTGTIPVNLGDRLEVLDLRGNVLDGPLHTELGLLTNLVSLRLGNNNNSGGSSSSLPTELVGLTNIRTLDLHGLGLTGTVPWELLGMNCVSLTSLDLSKNQLEGEIIPEKLSMLTNLRHMDLSENNFSNPLPPVSLCAIESLTDLRPNPCGG